MIAYTKPAMVLADEFSASGADMFPAIFQDNGRGPVFGMRSMGAGGSVVDWDTATFSEGHTRITVSQMNRKAPVRTLEYPAAPYVENIGVRPDIAVDYMTLDNLLNGGKTFVDAFTAAMVDLIQKSQPPQ
jgi:C-terminal processing protease CtpA/Prc